MMLRLQELLDEAVAVHWAVDPETGQVRSRRYGRPLKGKVTRDGYLSYGLPGGSRASGGTVFAHHVIWYVTDGLVPEGMTINHKNLDKTDNRRVNLEAITGGENVRHAAAAGRPGGGPVILTAADVQTIRQNLAGESIAALARRLGCSRKTVRDARDGKTWKAGASTS